MSDILRTIKKHLIRPLETRLNAMVIRVVANAVNDATKTQSLKIEGLADKIEDGVEHFQPGGLSHNAGAGAEGVGVRVGGRGDHTLVLGLANRAWRTKGLVDGETALYSGGTFGGTRVLLKADGSVEITPGGASPKMRVVGDLEVTGEITWMADTTPGTASGHQHPTAMGPTGPPVPGT